MNSFENSPPNSERAVESIDSDRGRIFPCQTCGANLTFHIGHQLLKCGHCGYEQKIELAADAAVVERDFADVLARQQELKLAAVEQPAEHSEIRCESCGANVIFEGTLTSTHCPYCGSPIQRENVHRGGFGVAVDGVLTFQIEQHVAKGRLQSWVQSRWFAPNDFKKAALDDRFQGVYLPFWTFDFLTFTRYVGERGDNYTVTTGSGNQQKRETRVRWSAASGQFQRFFDDVLIQAVKELPAPRIDELAPWPLQNTVPFTPEYLAGFFARTYDIDVAAGHVLASKWIDGELRSDCKRRIGGDEQRLHTMQVRCDATTCKHLLLPVWIVAYRYREKSYRLFINATTGKAAGDRPYSWVKITFAVICALIAIATVVLLTRS